MKTNIKTNIKKVAALMLAILSLIALISIMPEHSRAYTAPQAETGHVELIAQNSDI